MLVTRSFSKSFGLAGIRCGYIIGHPACIQHINKVRIGKNVNSLAQVAAIAALDDLSYTQRYIEEVQEGQKWLIEKMQSLNVRVVDTSANFILAQVAKPQETKQFLEDRGVYVRDRSHVKQLDGFLRITTAPTSVMTRFWDTFTAVPPEFIQSA